MSSGGTGAAPYGWFTWVFLKRRKNTFWPVLRRGVSHLGKGQPEQERKYGGPGNWMGEECLTRPYGNRDLIPLTSLRSMTQVTCRDWNPLPPGSSSRFGPGRLPRRRLPGPADFSLGPILAPVPQPAAAAAPQTRPWLGPRPPMLSAPAVAVAAAAVSRC